jgi:hypothetical protein
LRGGSLSSAYCRKWPACDIATLRDDVGGRSNDTKMIDSTHVNSHRSAAGGKRMARPVGKWFLQVAQTRRPSVLN